MDDAAAVVELLGELGYRSPGGDTFRKILGEILTEPRMGIIVAEVESEVVAFASFSCKPQLRLCGDSMELDELVVSARFRGRELGRALLDAVKAKARSMGAKRIVLVTNRERESYRRGFYTKNGFKETTSAYLKYSEEAV
jgi:N-acetylglutamate synthase-like GNAT family acetyltransferase